jgi:L-threonylcarbamoyladenylate synthase
MSSIIIKRQNSTGMEKEVEIIKKGGIGVIPTDTLYGIVALAFNPKSVEKVYKIKSRSEHKPFIVLIPDIKSLKKFNVPVSGFARQILSKIWPGKVTVILPCVKDELNYLHRGTKTIAFRMPKNKNLISFLKKTGPLVAPSANPEGKDPATTVNEAKKYFTDSVDFYINGGTKKSLPSTIIKIDKNGYSVIRQGEQEIYY